MASVPPSARAYVLVLAGAASVALGVALGLAYGPAPLDEIAARTLVAVAVIVSVVALQRDSFTFYWRGQRHRTTLDEIAVLQGFLFLPAALVPPLIAFAAVLGNALSGRRAFKGLFNVAQNSLSATAAWAAVVGLKALGASPLLAALPVPAVYTLVSNLVVAGLFSRLEGMPAVRIFRERLLPEAALSAAVGTGGGVAVAVLLGYHPLSVLALAPFVYLARRYGHLSAQADRELRVHRRLAQLTQDLVGTKDIDRAAQRVLAACAEVFDCERALLTLHPSGGAPRTWERVSHDGSGDPGRRFAETLPRRGGGSLGVLVIVPRRADHAWGELEHEMLRIVAGQVASAIENARALRLVSDARERLETYLDAAQDAIVLVALDGRVRYLNPAAQRLFGVPEAEPPDARADRFFDHPALTLAAGAPGEPVLLDTLARDAGGGRSYLIEAHVAPLREGGEVVGALALVRDVTERRRLEEEGRRQRELLEKQERLSALGTLVAGVAHEVNNPLAYLRGSLELAEGDAEALARAAADEDSRGRAARLSRAISRAFQGVDRIATVTRSLKAVARQGGGDRREEDVNALLADALEVARVGAPAGVVIEQSLAEGLPPVVASATELHQVFLNLVKNAAEALEPRGGGRILVRSGIEEGVVVIVIEDDGPGIPPEVRVRIFEPFYTTKLRGTGLGLPISLGIVQAHGGTMILESEPGRGTRFTIRLPAAGADDAWVAALAAGDAEAGPEAAGRERELPESPPIENGNIEFSPPARG